jgi:hypothetical protein
MSYYSVSRNQNGFVAVWPTKEVIYFARLNGEGELQSPLEVKTPGRAGMRTGMLALTAADGSTLLAWKKDHELSWQIYDKRGRPLGPPDSTHSAGSGVAGVLGKAGEFVLFR